MTIVKSSLDPGEELNNVQLVSVTQQEVISSQLTPDEVARDDLYKQAQTCVINMNKFCHQKKHGGATDIAEEDCLEPQSGQCCFMAPYGSTCLGTMCKMKGGIDK